MAWYYDRAKNVMVESTTPRPELVELVEELEELEPYRPACLDLPAPRPRTLDEVRDDAVRRAIVTCRGNITAAARQLGVCVKTMHSHVNRLELRADLDRTVLVFGRPGRPRKLAS